MDAQTIETLRRWRNRLRADQAMRFTTSTDELQFTDALYDAIETLTALSGGVERAGWQPIETAPVGEPIIALVQTSGGQIQQQVVIRHSAESTLVTSVPGSWRNPARGWQPLPPPPDAERARRE